MHSPKWWSLDYFFWDSLRSDFVDPLSLSTHLIVMGVSPFFQSLEFGLCGCLSILACLSLGLSSTYSIVVPYSVVDISLSLETDKDRIVII